MCTRESRWLHAALAQGPRVSRAYCARRRRTRLLAIASSALAFWCFCAGSALAAPANDDFAAATTISTLPFAGIVDTTGATVESGEPQFCNLLSNSVWYAITPSADGILSATASGNQAAQLTVYRQDGSGFPGLSFLGCENFSSPPVAFQVLAGVTYYLQASTLFGPGSLEVDVKQVVAPANDDFAAATQITSVPFADDTDLTAATAQSGEPATCGGAGQNTVWYAFTPSQSDSYELSAAGGSVPMGVFTGSSLASLQQTACGYGQTIFHADAGRTYYLQVGNGFSSVGPLHVSLTTAPPATASFYYSPDSPSMFDLVQFYDGSYDLAGIAAESWSFGDGSRASGCCPSHRYAADGTYSATLSITTNDGRTASTTRSIPVKTHDVSITKLTVPQSAAVGQTRQVAVDVSNTRYPETVQVTLLRSIPGGGFDQVGQVTQGVPARSNGRPTAFNLSYTFGPADATLGTVTFEAIAGIVGARDANPSDNTVIALPTRVSM